MSLFVVGEGDDEVSGVPHKLQFDQWKAALSAAELAAIDQALDTLISEKVSAGKDIVTSSWLPKELCPGGGHDWDGTPFMVIWEKACRRSWSQTGQCFGLFLWEHMMNRPERWHFMKCELDGVPIAGTTYFRCTQNR